MEFGGKKFLWGNMPAFDVVQLASNEGDDYGCPVRLLFAGAFFVFFDLGLLPD